jgi:hypothetical protein
VHLQRHAKRVGSELSRAWRMYSFGGAGIRWIVVVRAGRVHRVVRGNTLPGTWRGRAIPAGDSGVHPPALQARLWTARTRNVELTPRQARPLSQPDDRL